MRFNGSANARNPVWGFVSGIHDLLIYGVVTAIGAAIVILVVVPAVIELLAMFSRSWSTETDTEPELFELPTRTPEEIEKLTREWEETRKANEERSARDKKMIEEKEELEEQQKHEAIQRRKERSAHAVAHDALDDFL